MRRLKKFFTNRRLWLSSKLDNIAMRCRSAALYYELEHYIKRKTTFIKRVFLHNRGSGKTYALLRLAAKYDAPILISTAPSRRWCERYAHEMFPKKHIKFIIVSDISSVCGLHNELCLCEEGIKPETLDYIVKSYKCVVGYHAVY